MAASHWPLPGCLCVLAFFVALGAKPPASSSAEIPSKAGLIRIAGTVHMPDGSPAAEAIVEMPAGAAEVPYVARADATGRVELYGIFGNGAALHASSADGQQQTTLHVPAIAVRTIFASPIDLKLSPAIDHTIAVLSGGRPVEGARVTGEGHTFCARGVTDKDGQVTLRLPANERLQALVAWHPTLGINGVRQLDDRLPYHAGSRARARVFGRGLLLCSIYMESCAERQIGGSVQVGFRR